MLLDHGQGGTAEVARADALLFLIPWMLLQCPGRHSHTSKRVLERRFALWAAGDLSTLHKEALVMARRASTRSRSRPSTTVDAELDPEDGWRMSIETCENLRSAVARGLPTMAAKRLFDTTSGGLVEITDDVHAVLRDLHPAPQEDDFDGEEPPWDPPPPGIYGGIDGDLIRKLAGEVGGGCGPNGLTTSLNRKLLRSAGNQAAKLRDSMVAFARRLASAPFADLSLKCFRACRGAAFDKNPGIRPIGIPGAERRICCKAILSVTRDDLMEACGPRQAAAGLPGGVEAAAHAIQDLWDKDTTEMIILADAGNAFNTLNRARALRSTRQFCPALATAFQNMYGSPSDILYGDGRSVTSQEGATQGCPFANAMFSVGNVPLQKAIALPPPARWGPPRLHADIFR